MDKDSKTVTFSAVIFDEQKKMLEDYAKKWGSFSVSQVLRVILTEWQEMQERKERPIAALN